MGTKWLREWPRPAFCALPQKLSAEPERYCNSCVLWLLYSHTHLFAGFSSRRLIMPEALQQLF